MVIMNKVYKELVVYSPTDCKISWIEKVPYETAIEEKASDEVFYHVWELVNRSREIVVGVTIGGDFYQLSPAGYGTYIKESWNSMELVNKPKLLCAIAHYKESHRMSFD